MQQPELLAADLVPLTVNGEERRVAPGTSVAALLQHLALDQRKVAVELNEAIVPRSAYETQRLAAQDKLEIVHFIGGG